MFDRIHAWADAFLAAATAPGGMQAMFRLMRYLELVLSEQRFDEVRGILKELAPATEEAVMTYSERIFAAGRIEGRRDTLIELLAQKFGALEPVVVERIRAADPEVIEEWLARVLVAPQLSAIFEA